MSNRFKFATVHCPFIPTTTCLPEQAFNFTLHTRRNHAHRAFEMLLSLRELLQTVVSKPFLKCLNMFGISSAKGSKGNRMDVPHLGMVGLFPQPLAPLAEWCLSIEPFSQHPPFSGLY